MNNFFFIIRKNILKTLVICVENPYNNSCNDKDCSYITVLPVVSGFKETGGRSERAKKGRRGHFHRNLSVRGVECEGQETIWTQL